MPVTELYIGRKTLRWLHLMELLHCWVLRALLALALQYELALHLRDCILSAEIIPCRFGLD